MRFAGFPQETLDFLSELSSHNDRSWFEAHRDEYEQWYVEPARQFVVAAGAELHRFEPRIKAEPRILGSIFRINRDIRFSKDTRPYKNHLDFWFWEGDRKTAVSGFFARISPGFVGIGAGSHAFNADARSAFRHAMATGHHREQLEAIGARLTSEGYDLSEAPAPQARGLYVHVDEPAPLALTPDLIDTCAGHWRHLAPLHRWLVDSVQEPITSR